VAQEFAEWSQRLRGMRGPRGWDDRRPRFEASTGSNAPLYARRVGSIYPRRPKRRVRFPPGISPQSVALLKSEPAPRGHGTMPMPRPQRLLLRHELWLDLHHKSSRSSWQCPGEAPPSPGLRLHGVTGRSGGWDLDDCRGDPGWCWDGLAMLAQAVRCRRY
jgi:hypothetical protein